MEKLKTYVRDSQLTSHSRSSLEVIFSALLKLKTVSVHLKVPHNSPQFRKALKEIFSVANVILETCTTENLRDFDGLIPFVGAPRWPALKQEFQTCPQFDPTLLSKMASLITSDIFEHHDGEFMLELSKLARNCCLLGNDAATTVFHSHINNIIHWIEVGVSPASFLSQTIGILAMSNDDQLTYIWRILNHKIQSSSEMAKIVAVDCATSILINLLSARIDENILHLFETHWQMLRQLIFDTQQISLQAIDCIGSLCSVASFPSVMSTIGLSEVNLVEELQEFLQSKPSDASKVSVTIRALSRIAVTYSTSGSVDSFIFLHS